MLPNKEPAQNLTFYPLTPERWKDFEELFGPRGACGGCWCMWWRLKRSEFEKLRTNYRALTQTELAKQQVARFYKKWFDRLEAAPKGGRALALYQEFSSAFVLGKQLPNLPATERPGHRASALPQQFMLHCL